MLIAVPASGDIKSGQPATHQDPPVRHCRSVRSRSGLTETAEYCRGIAWRPGGRLVSAKPMGRDTGVRPAPAEWRSADGDSHEHLSGRTAWGRRRGRAGRECTGGSDADDYAAADWGRAVIVNAAQPLHRQYAYSRCAAAFRMAAMVREGCCVMLVSSDAAAMAGGKVGLPGPKNSTAPAA